MNISDFEKLKKKYEDEFNNGFWNLIINNIDISLNCANWAEISSNSNITWDIIQKNLDKDWDWWNISSNPNITLDIIKNNLDKPWEWNSISNNSMNNGKQLWIKNKVKIEIFKKVIYKIICSIIDSDICELIINYIK